MSEFDDKPEYWGYLVSSYQRLYAQEAKITSEDRVDFLNLAMQVWLTGALFPLNPMLESLPLLGKQVGVTQEIQADLKQVAILFKQLTSNVAISSKRVHDPALPIVSMTQDWIKDLSSIIETFQSSIIPQDRDRVFESFLKRIIYLRDDMTQVLPLFEKFVE